MTQHRSGAAVALGLALMLWTGGCTGDEESTPNGGPSTSVVAEVPLLSSGEQLQEGQVRAVVVGTHCGVRVLGPRINDLSWITDEATIGDDWIPDEWATLIASGQELIMLTVELSPADQTLSATAAGRSVTYRPVDVDDLMLDCA